MQNQRITQTRKHVAHVATASKQCRMKTIKWIYFDFDQTTKDVTLFTKVNNNTKSP